MNFHFVIFLSYKYVPLKEIVPESYQGRKKKASSLLVRQTQLIEDR